MARYDDPATLYDDPTTLYDDGVGGPGGGGGGNLSGARKTTTLLDSPFDSAFYSGAPVTTDAPFIFQVALNGRQYRIDPAQYRRNTLPTLRPPQDNSTEPGEQSLNTESVWRRSQGDWILGAGQTYYDDLAEPASNRTQFFTSRGINPWDRRKLSLQHDTRNIYSASTTNMRLISTPNLLYATTGAQLRFTDNPEALAPIWTTVPVGSSGITDLTTVGAKVYLGVGPDGVFVTSFGASTATQFSTYEATQIEFANGFLIAAKAGDISTIDGAGVASTIFTHFDASMEWTDIVATPQGAYVAGNTLGKAEVYFVGVDTTSGDLLPPTYASGLPNGETINQLGFYQGLMLMGTSRGLRLASIDSGHGLNYGPLIEIANGVTAFEPQGEFVWFSWSNYDTAHTGLGRVNLSRNTESGIPAYASDLMALTQGTVTGIASFNGRRYFGVASTGVFAEFEDYVPLGVIDSGFIRFGTVERKVAVSLDVRHDILPTGASVALNLIKDDETIVQCGVSRDAGTLGPPEPYPASQASTEAIRVVLELDRGTVHSTTPTVRRWTLRATPTPLRTDEIILPILMSEVVGTGEEVGQDMAFDTLGEFQALKNLESSRLVVTYQEGRGASYPVQVDRVMVRPQKWNSDTTFFNGLIFVRLLTIGS